MPVDRFFQVAPECHSLGLRAGAIVFRDLTIGPANAELQAEIQQEAAALRLRFPDHTAVRSSVCVQPFQELLRKVGAHPRRDRNSLEHLLSFAVKNGDLPTINSLVDAYNLVSIRRRLSLGAHDFDSIAPPVTLRFLTGTESFRPLGSSQPIAVKPGEFGYVDQQDRLLCRLDVVQADFSKVTQSTRNVLLIVEGTASHAPTLISAAVNEVISEVMKHCGGTAEVVGFLPPTDG